MHHAYFTLASMKHLPRLHTDYLNLAWDGMVPLRVLKFVTRAPVKMHSDFGDQEGYIEICEIQGSLWTSPTLYR